MVTELGSKAQQAAASSERATSQEFGETLVNDGEHPMAGILLHDQPQRSVPRIRAKIRAKIQAKALPILLGWPSASNNN